MTSNELASKYAVHPTQRSTWKEQFLENSTQIFSGNDKDRRELELLCSERDALIHQIGEQAF
jgi:hypothetical protein